MAVKIIVIHSRISFRFFGKIPALEFLQQNSVFLAFSMSIIFPTTGLIFLRDLLTHAPQNPRNKSAKFNHGSSISNKRAKTCNSKDIRLCTVTASLRRHDILLRLKHLLGQARTKAILTSTPQVVSIRDNLL